MGWTLVAGADLEEGKGKDKNGKSLLGLRFLYKTDDDLRRTNILSR
jgi:hypothetical protein